MALGSPPVGDLSAPPLERQSYSGGNSEALCFATILSALKIARFPAATAVPSRLSLHPRAPRISPGRTPARYTYIYKDRGTRTFSRRRWLGLGSPIVPVVQPSQSHMRKDAT